MLVKYLFKWVLSFFSKKEGTFKIKIVAELPEEPDEHILYVEGRVEKDDYWYALLKCPCGCGDNIMLNLIKDSKPCWTVVLDKRRPSIYPSIWRIKLCKSHFWMKRGKIVWV